MYETLDTGDDFGRAVEVLPALVVASPGFVPWSAAYELVRGLGPHTDAGLFAKYLVELMGAGDVTQARAVFGAVEDLLATDDIDIRDVIDVGLLEPMVGILSDAGLSSDSVREMMGPRTTQDWKMVLEE